MTNACAGARKQVDGGAVQLDAMRMPDIIANPADSFCIVAGSQAKSLQAIGDIISGLG